MKKANLKSISRGTEFNSVKKELWIPNHTTKEDLQVSTGKCTKIYDFKCFGIENSKELFLREISELLRITLQL